MSETTPALVLNAYAVGFFPMAESREDENVFWVDPDHRGVIKFDEFHIPRRFKSFLKKHPFKLTCNTDFDSVIHGCAAPTERRQDTWINDKIIELYTELHKMGYAHSIEVWQGKKLVGGLYGIALGSAFFAESMFSRVTEASKVALTELVARLKYSEFTLLDTQFTNDHLARFGGRELARPEYKEVLQESMLEDKIFYSDPDPDGWLITSLLQSMTQTS